MPVNKISNIFYFFFEKKKIANIIGISKDVIENLVKFH